MHGDGHSSAPILQEGLFLHAFEKLLKVKRERLGRGSCSKRERLLEPADFRLTSHAFVGILREWELIADGVYYAHLQWLQASAVLTPVLTGCFLYPALAQPGPQSLKAAAVPPRLQICSDRVQFWLELEGGRHRKACQIVPAMLVTGCSAR